MIPKNKRTAVPEILREANGARCMSCSVADNTVVAAHGPKSLVGGGIGVKADDYFIAFLCHHCHSVVDGRDSITTIRRSERDERWLRAHFQTMAYLWRKGVIGVLPDRQEP